MLMSSGIIALLWMLLGVMLVARWYPGYRHSQQVMSELGARNRPTTKIHPWINNFPIGFWFFLFGAALVIKEHAHGVILLTGYLMIVQGVSHWITGLFPCDEDLGIPKPSKAQIIHNLAGMVMYFSLLIACMLWIFSSYEIANWFRWYSALSVLVSVVSLVFMVRAFNTNINLGLHQRINYGVLALWVMVLSVQLLLEAGLQ